ncbi:nine-cis-epoxycarotenoid dioxygenase 6 [Artemisia annua]|uniref:Nine-cis-epoxycarotenoid dioxygenase 6 n=1 Tax=Artemisia annua TaxID=35608 RepID=A0A2U1MX23_ARTAN|nr:nine-cis-epoxycarotenoid dioxygenase 6 [Artemisia annua]
MTLPMKAAAFEFSGRVDPLQNVCAVSRRNAKATKYGTSYGGLIIPSKLSHETNITLKIKRYTKISPPPSKLLDTKKLPDLTTVSPPLLNPLQKLAASALDMFEWSLMELEKNHKLPKLVDPVVQPVGNLSPIQERPVQHGLEP